VVLNPDHTVEHVACNIFRECLDQIARNMVVVQEVDDPEGPHQLRIGLRCLRTAFSVFSPMLKSSHMTKLASEARWLSGEVGRLRDFDVVANDIAGREAKAYPQEPSLTEMAAALQNEATERRRCLRKLLIENRGQAFLIDLMRFVETR